MGNPILVLERQKMEKGFAGFTEKDFRYKFLNGRRFIASPRISTKEKFTHFLIDFTKTISSGGFLSPAEIEDVEISWREIEEGNGKKFRSVEEFLADLKR